MIPLKKLTFALLFAVTSPTLYASTSCSQGTDCLESINDNTYQSMTSTSSILDELQTNFGYGSGSFSALIDGSSINTVLNASSYLATRFFILDLALPVFNQPTLNTIDFNVAVDDDTNTFGTKLNEIHDIEAALLINNYFFPQINNGYNPIASLDIPPYVYPRTSQLLRNTIASVTPMVFINKIISDNTSGNYSGSTPITSYCPSHLAVNPITPDTNACILPYEQLNIIGGYGFTLDSNRYEDSNQNHTYNVSVPEYWDFLDQNMSPLVLPSLNADSLMNALTYEDGSTNTGKILPDETKLGLYGRTQLASADNFIRYLSGDLLPNIMSTSSEYQQYYKIATQSTCYPHRLDAAMKIKTYRTMLRTYAAQASVGNSNLYHLMQKRRPVTVPGTTLTQTSQLEQEYKMATYRLFNSSSTSTVTTTDWQVKLATASSAEIQRQMAVLLAEINYQLFLNRKEQERILLTLSAMQLSNNVQAKKQLTLNEAASYVSPLQIPSFTTTGLCTTTEQNNSTV